MLDFIIVLIVTSLPGFLLSLAIFKDQFDILMHLLLSLCFGVVIIPFISFVENLIGLQYTPLLYFANIFILSLSLLIYIKNKKYKLNITKIKKTSIILVVLVVFGMWVRLQSLSPDFYEFDPYFYQFGTAYLVKDGYIPLHDYWAGSPGFKSTHRFAPLMNYLTAGWYWLISFVNGQATYSPNLVTISAALYPVILGSLLSFLIYLGISRLYGNKLGLFSAFLITFTPQVIRKTAAGSQELQPFGIFSLLFFFASFILLLKNKQEKEEWKYLLFFSVALLLAALGSGYFVVIVPIWVFVVLSIAFVKYIFKESIKEILSKTLIPSVVLFISYILLNMHMTGRISTSFLSADILVVVGAVIILFVLDWMQKSKLNILKNTEPYIHLIVLCSITFIIFLASGLWKNMYQIVLLTGQSVPMMKTVAEQSPSPSVLFDMLSYIGFGPLPQLILFLFAVALVWRFYVSRSPEAILFAAFVLPIAWRGLQTSKYVVQLGVVLCVALSIVIGETLLFIDEYLKKKEEKRLARYAIYGLAGIFLLLHVSVPVIDLATQGPLYQYLTFVRVPPSWTQAMNWIRNSTEKNESFVSWWDYGHWINWFGERRSLTRNDHPESYMDLWVAYEFVEASPQELADFMKKQNVQYVLFDGDLIGKWGALVYLSGVWAHCKTLDDNNWWTNKIQCDDSFDWEAGPGKAGDWEIEHYFEYLRLNGICTAYPDKPIRFTSSFGVSYCSSEDGKQIVVEQTGQSVHPPKLVRISKDAFLNIDPDLSWVPNKNLKSKLYKSNFVQGFFEKKLPGFELVFENQMVRIFKLKSSQ